MKLNADNITSLNFLLFQQIKQQRKGKIMAVKIIRKVRRIRIKSPEEVAAEAAKKAEEERIKKEKLAKQAANRKKQLAMMMQLQMQAAAAEGS